MIVLSSENHPIVEKKVSKDVPREKQGIQSYPAVLIGRLGVHIDFQGAGIGSQLMTFIKSWFVPSNNKTGCRFITVDAYNRMDTISYYERNGFSLLFSTEDQEKNDLKLPDDKELRTRSMYFDLIKYAPFS